MEHSIDISHFDNIKEKPHKKSGLFLGISPQTWIKRLWIDKRFATRSTKYQRLKLKVPSVEWIKI